MAAFFRRKRKPALQFTDPSNIETFSVNERPAAQPVAASSAADANHDGVINIYDQSLANPAPTLANSLAPVDPVKSAAAGGGPGINYSGDQPGASVGAVGPVAVDNPKADAAPATNPYPSANPADLKPIEGFPGQFTDGRGRGGGDDINGSDQYAVYDAEGKFLGWNEDVHINGQTTNYGYSSGTQIPKEVYVPGRGGQLSGTFDRPDGSTISFAPPVADTAKKGGVVNIPVMDGSDPVAILRPAHVSGPVIDETDNPAWGGKGPLTTTFTDNPAPNAAAVANGVKGPLAGTFDNPAPNAVKDVSSGGGPGINYTGAQPAATVSAIGPVAVDNPKVEPAQPAPLAANLPTLPPQDNFTAPPPTISSIDPSATAHQVARSGHNVME